MDKVIASCLNVQNLYDRLNKKQGEQIWEADDYLQGLSGDVGDLNKLVMALNGKRGYKSKDGMTIDEAIAHELSDIIWSVIVLAKKYNINIEQATLQNMDMLAQKITTKLGS